METRNHCIDEDAAMKVSGITTKNGNGSGRPVLVGICAALITSLILGLPSFFLWKGQIDAEMNQLRIVSSVMIRETDFKNHQTVMGERFSSMGERIMRLERQIETLNKALKK